MEIMQVNWFCNAVMYNESKWRETKLHFTFSTFNEGQIGIDDP